jgi:uncharacterized C2H2 Zn-finger protein
MDFKRQIEGYIFESIKNKSLVNVVVEGERVICTWEQVNKREIQEEVITEVFDLEGEEEAITEVFDLAGQGKRQGEAISLLDLEGEEQAITEVFDFPCTPETAHMLHCLQEDSSPIKKNLNEEIHDCDQQKSIDLHVVSVLGQKLNNVIEFYEKDNNGSYKCCKCSSIFDDPNNFIRHIKNVHEKFTDIKTISEQDQVLNKVARYYKTIIKGDKVGYECVCGSYLKNKKQLESHYRNKGCRKLLLTKYVQTN